jgi:ribosomal protein L37E
MIFSHIEMEKTPKRCQYCGHSRAAHIDGMRCALCGCVPSRQTFVQDSFSFRTSLPGQVTPNTRKR